MRIFAAICLATAAVAVRLQTPAENQFDSMSLAQIMDDGAPMPDVTALEEGKRGPPPSDGNDDERPRKGKKGKGGKKGG